MNIEFTGKDEVVRGCGGAEKKRQKSIKRGGE